MTEREIPTPTVLCATCGGVGRRLVRGPRRYHACRMAWIEVCPVCNGDGLANHSAASAT